MLDISPVRAFVKDYSEGVRTAHRTITIEKKIIQGSAVFWFPAKRRYISDQQLHRKEFILYLWVASEVGGSEV
jgi:hypothetical protein